MFLSQPVTSGKSKELQLERFKYHFDWDKNGNKFKITEIHESGLIEFDKGLYQSLIQKILVDYLVSKLREGENHAILTQTSIIRISGKRDAKYLLIDF